MGNDKALSRVEAAAGSDPSEGEMGDTQKLLIACAALDEVTKPMAELLLERATNALLSRRGVLPSTP